MQKKTKKKRAGEIKTLNCEKRLTSKLGPFSLSCRLLDFLSENSFTCPEFHSVTSFNPRGLYFILYVTIFCPIHVLKKQNRVCFLFMYFFRSVE